MSERHVRIEAGLECIEYGEFSPEVRNGHLGGLYTLDSQQIASCGVRRVRYGIARARVYDARRGAYDLSPYAGPLACMRDLALEPVLDLNHFGPWLSRPDAPACMYEFAREVACAFPWVTWYTVVNEPTYAAQWLGIDAGLVTETLAAGLDGLRSANPTARHLLVDSLCLPWDPACRPTGPTHAAPSQLGERGWFGLLPTILQRVAVDQIGLDYYHFSEWCPFERRAGIARIGKACQELFARPFTISETSLDESDPRVPVDRRAWLLETVAGAEELLETCPDYDGRIYWYSWLSQFSWDVFYQRGALVPLRDGVVDLVAAGQGVWARRPVEALVTLIGELNGANMPLLAGYPRKS